MLALNRTTLVLLGYVFLSACGGGGGGGTPNLPSVNQPTQPTPLPPEPSPPEPPVGFGTPSFARMAAGDGAITVTWFHVENASGYRIYYALEPNVTPQSYATLAGGTRINDVTSPHTIRPLPNGSPVYVVVTAIANSFESGPTGEITATPGPLRPLPMEGTRRLNDSGMEWCATQEMIRQACPSDGFPDQDAEFGRDASARSGDLVKLGSGDAGFDLTKIDENGDVLDASAAQWSCVHDNVTGLMWEVKAKNGGLRHFLHFYTWYDPDDGSNGGDPGLQNGGRCTDISCDTHAYVQAVNQMSLCGFDDWRLPTSRELMSLANFGRRAPAIDTDFFPDVPPRPNYSVTWSSSTPGTSAALIGFEATTVDFFSGYVETSRKTDFGSIRLVRGDAHAETTSGPREARCDGMEIVASPVTTPTSEFTSHADGTITHRVTGLMWTRCPVGQEWNGSTCLGEAARASWAEALANAQQNTFAGYEDWRLPNIKELLSIGEQRCFAPSLNADIFPGNPGLALYWSSTADNNEVSDFNLSAFSSGAGALSPDDKRTDLPYRFVRDAGP